MKIFSVVKSSVMEFLDDDAMTKGAALAFFTVISLSPILLMIVSVAGLIGPELNQKMIDWITIQVGPEGGTIINRITENMRANRQTGIISISIGGAFLLFIVSGLLGRLQDTLNKIWNVKSTSQKHWIHQLLIKRLVSLIILFSIGIVLAISLVMSTLLISLTERTPIPLSFINELISTAIFTIMFAIIFNYLPDGNIAWRDVWVGAFITAVLFEIGKYGLSFYFSRSSIGSAYGAAGSLLVLLLWLYYSSLIFLFGAEFTEVYSKTYGSGVHMDNENK